MANRALEGKWRALSLKICNFYISKLPNSQISHIDIPYSIVARLVHASPLELPNGHSLCP